MSTPPPVLPPTLPPVLASSPRNDSFSKQAALFSLLAPFVGIAIGFAGNLAVQTNRVGMIVLGGTSTLLILTGFVFGIVALIGTKKHGRKGIFGRAIAGVCINGVIILFMLLAIPTFARAAEMQKTIQALRNLPRERLATAIQAFARERQAAGAPLPATVTFRELVSGGFLKTEESGGLAGKDAAVSLNINEQNPNGVWIRIDWSPKQDLVELGDGSIMLVSK